MNDLAESTHLQNIRPAYAIDEIERMATAVAESKLFGMKTKSEAFVLMLIAQAEGQHPATITQDYDIIQGKPARKTNSVLARYQASGGVVAWEVLTDQEARAKFTHKASGSVTINWTLAMAKQAGLSDKDVWKKFPRAMLRSRVIAEGVRASYPAAIGGMMVVEEAQDIPERDVTAQGSHTTAEPTKPAIEYWTAAEFDKNLPAWSKPIIAGKNTPDEMIEFASSRKPFTDEQKATIRKVKKPQTIDALATADQLNEIVVKAGEATVTMAEIGKRFNIENFDAIPAGLVPDILSFIKNPMEA